MPIHVVCQQPQCSDSLLSPASLLRFVCLMIVLRHGRLLSESALTVIGT